MRQHCTLISRRASLHAVLLLALNAVVSCAVAQSRVPNPATSEPATITVADSRPLWLEAVPVVPKDPTTAVAELCGDKPGEPGWLSQVRADIYKTVCSSAAWFDGFFGNARFDDEYQAVHGSVALGGSWDERDRWDPSVRFRARVRFPQMSERFNGFIGKVDPEEYVTELRDDFDALPRQFGREQDDAVLLGLGYGQGGRGGGHFDTSVGAKLGWPLEPYAKATYRYARPSLAAICSVCGKRSFGRNRNTSARRRGSTWSGSSLRTTWCAGPVRARSLRTRKVCGGIPM